MSKPLRRAIKGNPPSVPVKAKKKKQVPTTVMSTVDVNAKLSRYDSHAIYQKINEMQDELPELVITHSTSMLLSLEEQQMIAVCKVVEASSEISTLGTMDDPRMGTIGGNVQCEQCHRIGCFGHHGIIEFKPKDERGEWYKIYNPFFIREIISILNCVCHMCSRLIVTKEMMEQNGFLKLSLRNRLKELEALSKKLNCTRKTEKYHGGPVLQCTPNPIYRSKESKKTGQIMIASSDDSEENTLEPISIDDVFMILNNIPDEDARLMGFGKDSHPRDFIMRSILVLPLPSRPPTMDGIILRPHPLTQAYKDIVSAVRAIDNAEGSLKNDRINKLDKKVRKFLLGTDDTKKSSYENFISIVELLQKRSKKSLIRSTLTGKRTTFCARTVIDPRPDLRFGELGVPRYIANVLTVPERVTTFNYEAMVKLLKEGQIKYMTSSKGYLKGVERAVIPGKPYTLEIGDKVDRLLRNGDIVIINRQPTLHKQSMIGVRVKIIEDVLCLGLHPSLTTPLNADHDGDEADIWLPQNIQARAEVAELMSASKCIMSGETSSPIIGVVYDCITSAFILTEEENIVDKITFCDCMMSLTDTSAIPTLFERAEKFYPKKEMLDEEGNSYFAIPYYGAILFSALLPEDFYYERSDLHIVKGILVNGRVRKHHLNGRGSIIHYLWKQYGHVRTGTFINDATWMLTAYLDIHMFSVGFGDCIPIDERRDETIRNAVAEQRLQMDALNRIEAKDELEREWLEQQKVIIANNIKQISDRVAKEHISKTNAIGMMISGIGSAAKGSVSNALQMIVGIGQQNLQNKRIGTDCERLPQFGPNNESMEARGFCVNSFATGLEPHEFYHHAMATRRDIANSVAVVPRFGTIRRNLIKTFEDTKVETDGSVRNISGTALYQTCYGYDGFDPEQMITIKGEGDDVFFTFIDLHNVVDRLNSMAGFISTKTSFPLKKRKPIFLPKVKKSEES
jgi:DNA-directed RNA polymerase, beta'' subunit/160 kD subunit